MLILLNKQFINLIYFYSEGFVRSDEVTDGNFGR